MFINCPHCKALVATDPATDLPPEQCPRCAAKLRGAAAEAPSPAPQGRGATPAPAPGVLLDMPAPDAAAIPATGAAPPASELSSQIHRIVAPDPAAISAPPVPAGIAPIAVLLKPAPAAGAPGRPPAGEPRPLPRAEQDPAPQAATAPASLPVGDDDAPAAPATPAAAAPAPAAGATNTAAPSPPAAGSLPSFARRRAGRGRAGFDWKISVVALALALVLVLQLLLADRARLAADARWRPLVATLCGAFGCSVPPWREPAAFAVLARDVRPHPSTPGALRVTATFRNDARWPQPWPRLRLTLSDVDGHPVATRDFGPRDYLGAAPAQPELRSGQSASIAMDITEPVRRSVAFDFELH